MTIRPTLFAGPFLERRAELRDDPAWISAARSDPATRYLLTSGAAQLVTGGPSVEIAFLERQPRAGGWRARRRAHAVRLVSRRALRPGRSAAMPTPRRTARPDSELRELRPLAPLLPRRFRFAAGVRARAGLVEGRGTGIAGCAARRIGPARAGHVMRCSRAGCGTEAFPRLDPAIIVLVTDAGRRTRLVRPPGIVARGPLLHDRRLRRARRKPGRRGGARSGGGNRRAGGRRRIRRLTALAIPFVADAGIPRRSRAPMRSHCATASSRTRAGSRAPTSPRAIPRCRRRARSPPGSSTRWFGRRRRTAAPLVVADVFVSPGLAQPSAVPPRGRARIAMNSTRGPPRRWRPGPTSTASSAGATCRRTAPGSPSMRASASASSPTSASSAAAAAAPLRAAASFPRYLAGDSAPGEYLRALETDAPGYAGFNLLLADRDSLWYASNRADQFARELPPGNLRPFQRIPRHALAEARARAGTLRRLDAVDRARRTSRLSTPIFSRCWPTARPRHPTALPPGDLSPEWARKLSAPFVLDPGYGTRCSTVLTISTQGALRIAERRFDADGAAAGQSEHVLNDTDES